jgi:y4mF family transcriptional regulator
MTPQQIGKMIHYYRKLSGLTQLELARLAGVGKTVVFDIEKGKETIQLNTLLKILTVLNIKIIFETPLSLNIEKINT